jgi:hypothetical protein
VFEKAGLTAEERDQRAARFIQLYDELLPRCAFLQDDAPAANIMGLPRGLLYAMRADVDSLQQFRACNPDAKLIEQYLDTFDIENTFGTLVRKCGGKKPDIVTAMGAMRSCEILEKVRQHPARGFVMDYSRREKYDSAAISSQVVASTIAQWQGTAPPVGAGSAPSRTKRPRGKLAKAGASGSVAIRSYFRTPTKQ